LIDRAVRRDVRWCKVSAIKRTAMAKTSDYRIVTFQRKPGRWRANVTPIVQPAAARQGTSILGFVTEEDSDSEESAAIAADRAIRKLES
jgi:hypothetical protein